MRSSPSFTLAATGAAEKLIRPVASKLTIDASAAPASVGINFADWCRPGSPPDTRKAFAAVDRLHQQLLFPYHIAGAEQQPLHFTGQGGNQGVRDFV
jgi:hypothetical protein